ncbi:MAG: hypothetical protein SOY37_06475, partial [Oscillospiraceae bacterium]|nr:hypothetical protein [Oscillospiraceae bacterium]
FHGFTLLFFQKMAEPRITNQFTITQLGQKNNRPCGRRSRNAVNIFQIKRAVADAAAPGVRQRLAKLRRFQFFM